MNIPDSGKIISTVYIIGAILALFIVYRILSAVGIIKSGKKKKADQAKERALSDIRTMEEFNPLWGDTATFARIGDSPADKYAEDLRKAMRGLGTKEENIYSTFAKLKNRGNISEVAKAYQKKFKRDLRSDILKELTDKEVSLLYTVIAQL